MADNKRPGEFIQLDTPSLKLGSKDPLYRIFEELNRALRQIWVRLSGSVSAVSGTSPISSTGGTTPAISLEASTDSILFGRGDSSAGNAQEITLGAGLAMTGTTLSSSGSGGTVSVTGTPASGNLTKFSGASTITNGDLSGDATTSGTLAVTIANNAVTYPKMQDVSAASRLLGRGSASGSGDVEEITPGTGLLMTGTTLSAPGASSTYTPAHTNLTNLSATTPRVTTYSRHGDMVVVEGEFSADPTAPAATTSFEMSLPVASNFANTFECGGAGAGDSQAGYSVRISGNVANDTAFVSWIAADVSNQQISFIFGYRVI